jgi:alanine racemase
MTHISPTAPAQLTISLGAITDNYRLLTRQGTVAVAPVLKANAYGLGAAQTFKTLRAEGAAQFFIATPDEAAELRTLDATTDLFILGGLYAGADEAYIAGGFMPVLNSTEEIARWAATCKKAGRKLPAAIHFDTGMNRLGLCADETAQLLTDRSLLDPIDLRLIMSHFACSDEKDHAMNTRQASRFADIARAFPHVPKSLCNSSGIFRDPDWHYDLLRPGFALYGGNPTPEATNPMRRVVDLSVRILQTRCAKAGEIAGYSASYIFQNDTPLATVAMGYADGFHRAGSNKAKLYWNGRPCPIVGRVSMDLVIVDLGGAGDALPQAGDLLEVLGPHQNVDELARDLGTIGYEILTSLGKRYERAYI